MAVESKSVEAPLQPFPLIEPKPIPEGKISFEEFLDWCDEDIWAEWVDGEVNVMAAASSRHQQIASLLETLLGVYTEVNQLGMIFGSPFLMRLPFVPSGREPDLIYIATEHLSRLTDTYLDGPADVVVEIVSKESIDRDYNKKFSEYVLGDVPEYWLIDPLKEEALFYHLSSEGGYEPLPLEDGVIFRSQEISGFWLRVDWLWQTPLPDRFEVLQKVIPNLQTEALREARMRVQQEAHARYQEALARRQAEARAEQEANARRQAEVRAEQEANARRQAEQRAQQSAVRAEQEANTRRQAEDELARLQAELEALRGASEEEER